MTNSIDFTNIVPVQKLHLNHIVQNVINTRKQQNWLLMPNWNYFYIKCHYILEFQKGCPSTCVSILYMLIVMCEWCWRHWVCVLMFVSCPDIWCRLFVAPNKWMETNGKCCNQSDSMWNHVYIYDTFKDICKIHQYVWKKKKYLIYLVEVMVYQWINM